jgi:hypothetical protein
MTRSQCGSLLLHCMKLSFTTPCRLLPAHLNFEPPQSFERSEAMERLERLERTDPVVNGAQRLNAWNNWNWLLNT